MEEVQKPRHPARLGRALRRGILAAYDHLGWVVGFSFVLFATSAAAAGFGLWAARLAGVGSSPAAVFFLLPAVLVWYLGSAGGFYYAGKAVSSQHPAPLDCLVGIRVLLFPALVLLALDAVVAAVLVGDTVFFLALAQTRSSALLAVPAVVCGYLSVVWAMMCLYHFPLLVAQLDMQSGPRPLVVVRKSFLLLADNPAFTAALFIVIIAIAVLCALPALIGTAVLFPGATAFILTHALRELFVRYGVVEEEPEVVEDRPWTLPDHWRKRGGAQESNGPQVE